ncbi:MAG: hypothetical protein N2578_07830 [Bdellovibrionaceae bacterium]|nr:hypothetical protein [Pseudobdellovibrionaceae bacterium]
MGKFIQSLKKGDAVQAMIVEVLSRRDYICAIQGELVRVTNHSKKDCFRLGESVSLCVINQDPLELRLEERVTDKLSKFA